MNFTRKPVGADTRTLGTPIRLDSRAYCVAVNRLWVMLAINAAKAEVPMPPVKFSKAMTADRAGTLGPVYVSSMKPAVETA